MGHQRRRLLVKIGNALGDFEGRDALAECMREGYKDRARKVLDDAYARHMRLLSAHRSEDRLQTILRRAAGALAASLPERSR